MLLPSFSDRTGKCRYTRIWFCESFFWRRRLMVLYFLTWYTSGELFRDSRPACGGPRRGEGSGGEHPATPARGLRPPAPPADPFSVLYHVENANTMRRLRGEGKFGGTASASFASPLFLDRVRSTYR